MKTVKMSKYAHNKNSINRYNDYVSRLVDTGTHMYKNKLKDTKVL
jgi:hypothetical protein